MTHPIARFGSVLVLGILGESGCGSPARDGDSGRTDALTWFGQRVLFLENCCNTDPWMRMSMEDQRHQDDGNSLGLSELTM